MPVQMDCSDITYDNGITTFTIGDVVYVNGEGDYRGKISYLGNVHFSKGEFAGIVLDHPLGNHDGSTRGRRYFQCEPNHGIFARVSKLSKYPLIPATNDSERCGLYRESPPPPPLQPRSSFSRETSPSFSLYSSVGTRSSFSKSPSPTPPSFSKPRSESWGGTSGVYRPLRMGDRVIVASSVGETKTGVLRYLGPVEFASGEWAGIELFHPLGKNDGTVRGRHYFTCRHPYGLFVPSYKVELSPANRLSTNRLGTKDNVDKVLQYTTTPRYYSPARPARKLRAGSIDDDFY